jgi:4-hydroxybenzoate polyprenyltransferase
MSVGAIDKRLRVYFGFSRMSHSVLDIGHPAVGALLVLGAFPPFPTMLIGFIAAFAGFTAVFALNDLMDYKVDTERIERYQRTFSHFDIDVLGVRHPIAQKMLTFPRGLAWVLFWGILSLAGAYILNPVCCIILVGAVIIEVVYCALLRVTHWKGLLSGAMVGIGALAGVFAVVREPSLPFLVLFFLWAFGWEFGARNIPNDWTDLEEDVHLSIKTLPVRYGRSLSSRISFLAICLTVFVSFFLPLSSLSLPRAIFYELGAAVTGGYFLVIPAWKWMADQSTESAMSLFNKACIYPATMLLISGMSVFG